MAMLDSGLDRLREGDRRIEVEAVKGPARSGEFRAHNGSTEGSVGKWMPAKIPRAQEIVFGAGAVDGGESFAVNEEHVIAFAPPTILVLQDGHGHADEMALALGFQPDVIPFSVEILLSIHERVAIGLPLVRPTRGRIGLAVLRMEIECVLG